MVHQRRVLATLLGLSSTLPLSAAVRDVRHFEELRVNATATIGDEVQEQNQALQEYQERFRKKVALVDLALGSSFPTTPETPPSPSADGSSLVETSTSCKKDGQCRAFIVSYEYGTEYYTGVSKLRTLPDAIMVFERLLQKGFKAKDITVLTDAKSKQTGTAFPGADLHVLETFKQKTATYFWQQLKAVSSKLKEGDFLVVHLSGHGVQVGGEDSEGWTNELDGMNEAFVAGTYPTDGLVMDNDIYAWITTLPARVSLTMVADACHSEGFSDLPFNYNPGYISEDPEVKGKMRWNEERTWCTDLAFPPKALPAATVRFFSGSQNRQTSIGTPTGGVLTDYLHKNLALKVDDKELGSVYARMAGLHIDFFTGRNNLAKQHVDQEPNICAWPTFRDTDYFKLWSNLLEHDKANGGLRPSNTARMRAPPRCTEFRNNVPDSADGFEFLPILASATGDLQGNVSNVEGWEEDGVLDTSFNDDVDENPELDDATLSRLETEQEEEDEGDSEPRKHMYKGQCCLFMYEFPDGSGYLRCGQMVDGTLIQALTYVNNLGQACRTVDGN